LGQLAEGVLDGLDGVGDGQRLHDRIVVKDLDAGRRAALVAAEVLGAGVHRARVARADALALELGHGRRRDGARRVVALGAQDRRVVLGDRVHEAHVLREPGVELDVAHLLAAQVRARARL
jgi:hypothetical protein